ncbi:MAG: helix-turn-helix transcriptional regulator [Pyrinomonadaceae bacterium]|jgi:transcriptional regulator with XRE-family HTH domain|nr:helix-turn-helix transcriptional regulator [Pyrinomonadaceae bacterium]
MIETQTTVGNLLKLWRERRRKSQLELALDAEISTRHLSFVETGRAKPSREMILLLAENLEIPLRERNKILITGGYAPIFSEKTLDDVSLSAVRTAIDLILQGHEPFPALAVDRYWNMVAANKVVPILLDEVSPKLLENPINVLRLSLHPEGLAPKIVNFTEWRNHILKRLRKQADDSADEELEKLFDELSSYKFNGKINEKESNSHHEIIVPLQIQSKFGVLSFISTVTVFGTPIDVTVSEIALETFFPADEKTREIFNSLGEQFKSG